MCLFTRLRDLLRFSPVTLCVLGGRDLFTTEDTEEDP